MLGWFKICTTYASIIIIGRSSILYKEGSRMLEFEYMNRFPSQYITIVKEVEHYTGASVHTDQIIKRVLYRIKQLYNGDPGTLTSSVVKAMTRKAACEIMKTKRQTEVLTDFDLSNMYADNVQEIDDQIADNDLIQDIILLAKNDDERFITRAWSKGYSDSQIARALTKEHGEENTEKYRAKIKRFKKSLRNEEVYKTLTA